MTENLPINSVTFLPLDSKTLSNSQNNMEFKERLPKGKYDIDYSIGVCRMIIKHCDDHVLQAGNFGISLKHSLKKLMSFLEHEKQGKQKDPIILFTCEKCGESETIPKSREMTHQCTLCNQVKKLENKMLEIPQL